MNLAGRDYARYQPQSQGARGYPSYSSRGGRGGRGHQPSRDYERQEYSGRSDAFSGNNRGYGPTMYGRQPQGYSDRGDASYRRDHVQSSAGDELTIRGQMRGRGREGGHRGQMRPRGQSRGRFQTNSRSELTPNSEGDAFYSSRNYIDSTSQENSGVSRYPRGRGRGGGRGGYPGAARGMGRGRGSGRGRGRGRGGNFPGRHTKVFPEYKSLVEMANLPEQLSMKELRSSLKEIPLDPKFHIQFLYEKKAAVKILEDFNDVVDKLKEIKFGENEDIEISEGKLKPRKNILDGHHKSSAVYIKFLSTVDSKILEESLKKIDLNPRLVLTGGKEPGSTFSSLDCGDVKEAKKKIKDLKIPGFEVGGVKVVMKKQPLMIVKLSPKTGHLKLENLPNDCDPKKLKLKLKQKLAYDMTIGKIEDGKVDVRYSPKTMVVLEKLAGLIVGENEVKVKEVDDGEDDHQDPLIDDQLKFALPKDLTKENFDKILGTSLPNEIQLGEESFTLKFTVPAKVIKNVKKFVLDSTSSEIASKINRSRDKSLDAINKPEDDTKGAKREVKAVFGSTDIRFREEKALGHEEAGGEKMRPSGETN